MEFRQAGDSEYSLIMEEKIRECIPTDYGVGTAPDGKRFAAIILKDPLEDKGLYENADIKSRWEVAHFRIIGIEKVFLKLDFGSGRILKFYINLFDLNFITIRELWFSLIIETNGMIAISDRREPSIIADGIPVDVPKFILEHLKGAIGETYKGEIKDEMDIYKYK